jgi:Domain of unknown function (DUF397)
MMAEPWRKGTRSGHSGCVEAARVTISVVPAAATVVAEAGAAE